MKLDLTDFVDDGDTIELDDGRILRLSVESDQGMINPFEEYDCYGKVEYVDSYSERFSRPGRPEGFDGNAEILQVGRSDFVWWQPPPDMPRSDPHFNAFRANVINLASFGMYVMTVELCEGHDAYHRPIVRSVASLAGIEPFADEAYRRTIVSDLVDEVLNEEGIEHVSWCK